MPKPKQVPPSGRLVALIPRRLMAPTSKKKLPKDVTDPEHERVVRQSADWQQLSSHAVFWEMGAISQGAEKNRTYGLVGQMAAVGEQLGLAYSAAVEVALWRWVRDKVTEPDEEKDAAREMSMRAMAESQCYFVMGAGQALANVCVYALALDPTLRASLGSQFRSRGGRPSFMPFSSKKEDWVFMNEVTGKRFLTVVSASPIEVVELVQPVADFSKSSVWKDLASRRGEDYHQWRPQTHGIDGVSKTTPWKTKGKTHSLGLGPHVYADAKDLADETSRIATDAMLELARVMETFLEKWTAASGTLGGPRFK